MTDWSFDLNDGSIRVEPPNGYRESALAEMSDTPRSAEGNEAKTIALKQKRAMEIAYAPGKNLFMTGFMLWMSGAGVHIFSIMMTAMAMFQPIRGIMSVNMTFKSVEGKSVDLT